SFIRHCRPARTLGQLHVCTLKMESSWQRCRIPAYNLFDLSSFSFIFLTDGLQSGKSHFSMSCRCKVVHAETTVAHAVLNGNQYYHQDWAHAAAHVIVPPLRLDPNTPSYLMGLLGKYVLCLHQ
ncbi:hypothetical protein XENOCAPTIV_013813, partial [Xenoophorus captivus]